MKPSIIKTIAKQTHIQTRIAGYCASSTECSDTVLEKRKKTFLKLMSFFPAWCDKKMAYASHSIRAIRQTVFEEKGLEKKLKNFFFSKFDNLSKLLQNFSEVLILFTKRR